MEKAVSWYLIIRAEEVMSPSITIPKVPQRATLPAAPSQPQGRLNRLLSWLRILCCTCPACRLPPHPGLDYRARFLYDHRDRFLYYAV